MSEEIAGARGNLFRVARTGMDATVRALVVATAGPGILPDGPATVAFVVVDEGGLAAGFVLPLMRALFLFFRQRCDLWLALRRHKLTVVCQQRSGGRVRQEVPVDL
jgi:hypothetical protein